MNYNTNGNSNNINYHKLIPVSIEEARNWYKGDDNVLKTLALRAFSKKELGHSFRDIKSFKDACDVLKLNHDDLIPIIANIIIFGHSIASAATFKLNIIRKALNLNYNLNLTNGSSIYYPINPFVTESFVYGIDDISSGNIEIIGSFKDNGVSYNVLSGQSFICGSINGLGNFSSGRGTNNFTLASLGCATEEIAKHFGKYFGMLITEAKYGDITNFEIISSKYNNL